MLFRNARLLLPAGILSGASLRVRDGRIAALGNHLVPEPNEAALDLGGKFLSPGFIDMHIHGALHRDSMEATPEAFSAICQFHATGGTTALALTTVTAPTEAITAVLEAAGKIDPNATGGARLLGIHIEGPYFSKEKPGAHPLELIREPQPEEYNSWLKYSKRITQMTLAPELPGALALIGALQSHGIRASGGHSDAWDEDAAAAFAHGMRQVTHTFNCMSSARRRGAFRAAGLLEFAMGEPEILCELIADGFHVSATLMRALYRAKGRQGIALVTDAGAGAGLADGESFVLGGIRGVVDGGVALTEDRKALCSSVARMNTLVRVMVEQVDVPLLEAVHMASANPARALGLEDQVGSLAEGLQADLVVLDDTLEVEMTFVSGQRVF
ncbi:MAG: N-acetylglucosamine-6-phosphate deacetylase [Verrucomicrobia bacterium]|nr:MAG: N-acetylglucosamine-6-phosphate deacetylase [Verrucomicrobiota bacterium]